MEAGAASLHRESEGTARYRACHDPPPPWPPGPPGGVAAAGRSAGETTCLIGRLASLRPAGCTFFLCMEAYHMLLEEGSMQRRGHEVVVPWHAPKRAASVACRLDVCLAACLSGRRVGRRAGRLALRGSTSCAAACASALSCARVSVDCLGGAQQNRRPAKQRPVPSPLLPAGTLCVVWP